MQTSWIVRIWPERTNFTERVPLYRSKLSDMTSFQHRSRPLAEIIRRETMEPLFSIDNACVMCIFFFIATDVIARQCQANSAENSLEKTCEDEGIRDLRSEDTTRGRLSVNRNENFIEWRVSSSLSTSTV